MCVWNRYMSFGSNCSSINRDMISLAARFMTLSRMLHLLHHMHIHNMFLNRHRESI